MLTSALARTANVSSTTQRHMRTVLRGQGCVRGGGERESCFLQRSQIEPEIVHQINSPAAVIVVIVFTYCQNPRHHLISSPLGVLSAEVHPGTSHTSQSIAKTNILAKHSRYQQRRVQRSVRWSQPLTKYNIKYPAPAQQRSGDEEENFGLFLP